MDTTTMLLITTMVMALGAITFSALNLAFDRSHYRKSVRPFCNVVQSCTEQALHIQIENAGAGPMILQSILLLEKFDDPVKAGVQLTKDMLQPLDGDVFALHEDKYVLASLCKLSLLQSTAAGSVAPLKSKLSGRTLYIQYVDVYDRVYEKRAELTI